MKSNRVRGMRDIPTVRGLRSVSVPTTREEAVAELARMEHEKARLQRELDMWIKNQRTTENRLRQVEVRLSLLEEILNPPAGDGAPKRQVRRAPVQEAENRESSPQNWKEIPLEY